MRLLLVACAIAAACGGNAAVTPPAKAPTTTTSPPQPPSLTSADVDALVRAEWQKSGLTPAARADDARYLRRLYLDVVGTLPPPEKVNAFLADTSADKRAKIADELLASGAYPDHWMAYWDDVLMGQTKQGDIDRQAFRVWLHDQFEKNTPWDKVAYSLITATGKNSTGGAYGKSLAQTEAQMTADAKVDGAVNYVLKFRDDPRDMAGSASKTFLGVQIQCAQCHDHKTEKWKQTDFQKFAACFMRTGLRPQGEKGMKGIKAIAIIDLDRPAPRFDKNADLQPVAQAKPTALDGTEMSGNVRQTVASWITKNPWFAQETVNRMWGHFLGRGFVNPVDDLRPGNPPDAPEILDKLAKDFTDHGYDVKRLMKLITQTEVYQLDSTPPPGSTLAGGADIPLWSQFHMAPLGPEELVNALIAATGTEAALTKLSRADIDDLKVRLTQLFSFVFDVDEEFDKPRFEGTLTQALVLLNGKLVAGGSSALPGTAIVGIAHSNMTDAARIEALYLRTLSRKPTPDELDAAIKYISSASAAAPPTPPSTTGAPVGVGGTVAPGGVGTAGAPLGVGKAPNKPAGKPKKPAGGPDPLRGLGTVPVTTDPKVAALEDVMWALLNSSEFVFNH